MGTRQEIYVGPFLRAEHTDRVVIRSKIVCPNGHRVKDNFAFCPICGEEMVAEKYEDEVQVCYNDIVGEEQGGMYEDELLVADAGTQSESVCVPNANRVGIWVDEDDITEILHNRDEEIEKFLTVYGDLIAVVQKHLTIRVEYGCVVWWW